MPFKATFGNGGAYLRKVIEIVSDKDHIKDGLLVVNSDGLFMQTMDSCHIAMVDLHVSSNAAREWTCDSEYTLGVSLAMLLKVLKSSSGSASLCTLKYDPVRAVLNVSFAPEEGGKAGRSAYKLKLLDLETERVQVPEEIVPTEFITLDSIELYRTLRDLTAFAEDVNVTLYGDTLNLVTEGDMTDADLSLESSTTVNTRVQAKLKLEYLVWFLKGSTLCDTVSIGYKGDGTPVCFTFNTEDVIRLRFFLAVMES